MPGQRPPAISPVPRTGLGSRAQESVDSFLKALKFHTRRLSSVMEVHAAELALLERLYYKGKNQHGASLLWARVREMRRYAQKLRDQDLLNVTQNLRAAFYGETTPASSKKLKGSWTHYPDSLYLTWLLRRLATAAELADKTTTSMLRVFEWILLFMQNGEFLQMTVTFSALAARFRHLSIELQPLVHLMHEDMRVVLIALYPAKANRVRSLVLQLLQQKASESSQDSPIVSVNSEPELEHNMDIDEDLGVTVSRVEPSLASLPPSRTASPPPDSPSSFVSTPTPVTVTTLKAKPHIVTKAATISRNPKPAVSAAPRVAIVMSKRKDPEPALEPPKKVKKKKAKRDEIDDIFG